VAQNACLELDCGLILSTEGKRIRKSSKKMKSIEKENLKLLAIAYFNFGIEEKWFKNYKAAMLQFHKSHGICVKYKFID
jgi:hypothetical protein